MIKTFLEIILYVDGIILIELPYDLEFGDGGYAMNYFDLLPLENIIKARFVFKNVEPIETEARDAKHLHIFRILAAIYLARGSNKNAARLLGISPRMLCYRRGQFLDVHKWEKLDDYHSYNIIYGALEMYQSYLDNERDNIYYFKRLLEEGVNEGEFEIEDTYLMAFHITTMGIAWINRRQFLKDLYSIEDYIRKITDSILKSIQPKGGKGC